MKQSQMSLVAAADARSGLHARQVRQLFNLTRLLHQLLCLKRSTGAPLCMVESSRSPQVAPAKPHRLSSVRLPGKRAPAQALGSLLPRPFRSWPYVRQGLRCRWQVCQGILLQITTKGKYTALQRNPGAHEPVCREGLEGLGFSV